MEANSQRASQNEHKTSSVFLLLASIILAAWIFYLIFDLPTTYRADHWDVAWVGFDIGMLATLLTTSWALWKKRQIAIPGAMVSATLLIVDSWFDVVTSNGGLDFKIALASAVLIELPAAYLLIKFSRRAVKRSIQNANSRVGVEIVSVSLWRTPLTIFEIEN